MLNLKIDFLSADMKVIVYNITNDPQTTLTQFWCFCISCEFETLPKKNIEERILHWVKLESFKFTDACCIFKCDLVGL